MTIIAVTYVYGGDPQELAEHRPRHREFLAQLRDSGALTEEQYQRAVDRAIDAASHRGG